MRILIDGGTAVGVYDERLNLSEYGQTTVTRASFVEPSADAQWWVTFRDGTKCGPFPRRSAALAFEVAKVEGRLEEWL